MRNLNRKRTDRLRLATALDILRARAVPGRHDRFELWLSDGRIVSVTRDDQVTDHGARWTGKGNPDLATEVARLRSH